MLAPKHRTLRIVVVLNGLKSLPGPAAVLCAVLFFPVVCANASRPPAEDFGSTRIGRAVLPLAAAHPGLSGVYPLRDARDAFAARLRLAQVAERTLGLQHYEWNDDLTGSLLFEAVRAAADRGEWDVVRTYSDDPAKGQGRTPREGLLSRAATPLPRSMSSTVSSTLESPPSRQIKDRTSSNRSPELPEDFSR